MRDQDSMLLLAVGHKIIGPTEYDALAANCPEPSIPFAEFAEVARACVALMEGPSQQARALGEVAGAAISQPGSRLARSIAFLIPQSHLLYRHERVQSTFRAVLEDKDQSPRARSTALLFVAGPLDEMSIRTAIESVHTMSYSRDLITSLWHLWLWLGGHGCDSRPWSSAMLAQQCAPFVQPGVADSNIKCLSLLASVNYSAMLAGNAIHCARHAMNMRVYDIDDAYVLQTSVSVLGLCALASGRLEDAMGWLAASEELARKWPGVSDYVEWSLPRALLKAGHSSEVLAYIDQLLAVGYVAPDDAIEWKAEIRQKADCLFE